MCCVYLYIHYITSDRLYIWKSNGSVNKTPNMLCWKERHGRRTGWNEKKNVPCIGWNRCFNFMLESVDMRACSAYVCVSLSLSVCIFVSIWSQVKCERARTCVYVSVAYAAQFHTVFFLYLLWSYCCFCSSFFSFSFIITSSPPPLPPPALLLLLHRCSSRLFSLVSSTYFICMHSHILQSHSNRAPRRTLAIAITITKT